MKAIQGATHSEEGHEGLAGVVVLVALAVRQHRLADRHRSHGAYAVQVSVGRVVK